MLKAYLVLDKKISSLVLRFCMLCLYFLLCTQCVANQSPDKDAEDKAGGSVKRSASVAIDPSIKYQVIEGWGEGSMDTFIPVWYYQFRKKTRDQFLDSLYTMKDNGLGLNICRFLMPVGDNPEHDHMIALPPVANVAFEPEEGVFTWAGHEDILWHAEGARDRGATMWAGWYAPPYWLTVSGCSAGSVDGTSNNLAAGKEARYAEHICDVLKHFGDEWDINFDYISNLNEPDLNCWVAGGGQPNNHVDPEQAIVIIRTLGERLKKEGLTPKIQAFDSGWTKSYTYLDKLLKSDIEPLLSVLSCHQYHTTDEVMDVWHQRAVKYNKSLWSTEWGDWANAGYPDNKPYQQALRHARKIHDGLKILKANAWVIWEPGFLFDVNALGMDRRKAYWVVAHYSRHVRPGYQQIYSQDSVEDCKTTAWISPDGKTLVLVTFNEGDSDVKINYDLSKFSNVNIREIRLTSKTQDYAEIKAAKNASRKLTMEMPSGSIMTITASYN